MQAGVVARWFAHRRKALPHVPAFEPADFRPALKTRLLVLQPTPFCNIRCDYCYLPDRDSKARMTLATVRQATQRLVDDQLLGETLTVVWHAGEPLAMPREFYAEAFAAVQQTIGSACRLSHSIQTNAMLIDDAWCALFKHHDVRIGVSVDGPSGLHDAHRRTRHGHGTHHRVLRGMDKLREHGIPFHVIAVVTSATFDQIDEFARFFEEQGIAELGCNFDEAEGSHTSSSLDGREDAHRRFLQRMFEKSADSKGHLRLREFTTANWLIAHPLPRTNWRGIELPDNVQTLPFAIVNVAWNGDFGCFSPELLGQSSPEFGSFLLGNVANDGYLASARREPFISLWSAIQRGVEACRGECAYFSFCGGGSPVNKFYENGDLSSTETLYCRSMVKRPFETALSMAESLRHLDVPARLLPMASIDRSSKS